MAFPWQTSRTSLVAHRAHLIGAAYSVLPVGIVFVSLLLSALNVFPLSFCGMASDAHGRQIAQSVCAAINQGHRVIYLICSSQEIVTSRAPPCLSSCHNLLFWLCDTTTHFAMFLLLQINAPHLTNIHAGLKPTCAILVSTALRSHTPLSSQAPSSPSPTEG